MLVRQRRSTEYIGRSKLLLDAAYDMKQDPQGYDLYDSNFMPSLRHNTQKRWTKLKLLLGGEA